MGFSSVTANHWSSLIILFDFDFDSKIFDDKIISFLQAFIFFGCN